MILRVYWVGLALMVVIHTTYAIFGATLKLETWRGCDHKLILISSTTSTSRVDSFMKGNIILHYMCRSGTNTIANRWGDAPVHSIAAALMLKRSQVHWFYDIGYFHNPWTHCPSEPSWLGIEKCSCDPANSFGK